jgi:hypothetical protein
MKRRTAKKRLSRLRNSWMLKSPLLKVDVGGYVNDCSGQNGKVLSAKGLYHRGVLADIDIQTENTGCSLCSCGVEPAQPREKIQAAHVDFLREYVLGEQGKTWYGQHWEFYANQAKKILAAADGGETIVDETGRLLPQFSMKHHDAM